MKRYGLFCIVLAWALGLALAVPGSGMGEIYRWTNDDGSTGFADNPDAVPEKYRKQDPKARASEGGVPSGESAAVPKKPVGKAAAPEMPAESTENIKGFSKAQTKIIAAAMREWKTRYECGREVEVESFNARHRDLGNGFRETTVETAGPGYMKITPASKVSLRNIVLHAMTHACQPDEPTILPRPVPYNDSIMILGYHGASIKVRYRDGTEGFFRRMEEGICERNASYFPGYTVSHPSYFAAGKLAREHFPEVTDPMALIRNNDVPGLIGLIVGNSSPSRNDVRKVMVQYEERWQGN